MGLQQVGDGGRRQDGGQDHDQLVDVGRDGLLVDFQDAGWVWVDGQGLVEADGGVDFLAHDGGELFGGPDLVHEKLLLLGWGVWQWLSQERLGQLGLQGFHERKLLLLLLLLGGAFGRLGVFPQCSSELRVVSSSVVEVDAVAERGGGQRREDGKGGGGGHGTGLGREEEALWCEC